MQHMAGRTMVNLLGIWNRDLQMVENFFKTPRSVWRTSYLTDDDELNLDIITATHFWSGLCQNRANWRRDSNQHHLSLSHTASLSHFKKLNITDLLSWTNHSHTIYWYISWFMYLFQTLNLGLMVTFGIYELGQNDNFSLIIIKLFNPVVSHGNSGVIDKIPIWSFSIGILTWRAFYRVRSHRDLDDFRYSPLFPCNNFNITVEGWLTNYCHLKSSKLVP